MTDNPRESSVPLLVVSAPDTNTDTPLSDGATDSSESTTVAQNLPKSEESVKEDEDLTLNKSYGVVVESKPSSPTTSSVKSEDIKSRRKHRRSHSDGYESQSTKTQNGSVPPMNGALRTERQPSCIASQSGLRHRICIEEVVPSMSSYLGEGKKAGDVEWKTHIDDFTSKRCDKTQRKNLPRSVRRYYKMQDELINAFENLHLEIDDAMENAETNLRTRRWGDILAKVSFVCNLLLLIGKAVAAGMSGSLAVISSVIDSAVDLVSGGLMWWSNRAVRNRNIYEYPQGRTKLEPVAIVVLSVVMSLASVQMVRESVEKIIYYSKEKGSGPVFGVATIVICSLTVVIKFILWLLCRRIKTSSAQALAQDHRNDVLSNSIAIACGIIGDRVWPFADPIGAIVISSYIIISWFLTGWEQIKMLTGHTARPEFLKKITWLAVNHHPSVMLIDTVRAFHFGNNFLVEVDIVLPEDMTLHQSHDIGESLQLKIERLPEVERAFVHLDYETDHSPFSEHKQV